MFADVRVIDDAVNNRPQNPIRDITHGRQQWDPTVLTFYTFAECAKDDVKKYARGKWKRRDIEFLLFSETYFHIYIQFIITPY